MKTNGEPFLQVFWHGNTLAIGTKLKKTLWEILKVNQNKRSIKAPKHKPKKKLKICKKLCKILLQSFKCDKITLIF